MSLPQTENRVAADPRALGGVDQTTVIRLQQARDLPADLRDELLQSAGESYPKGYESLLERYYRALSESEK
ncbi:MAG: hypothetical protein Ct9H300mP1_16720 [Planctomycetaceae bacterium]|nr:MAG: hypothetical protein Ct9H300mP1_16720 [Planctomycetaceae bacterium]